MMELTKFVRNVFWTRQNKLLPSIHAIFSGVDFETKEMFWFSDSWLHTLVLETQYLKPISWWDKFWKQATIKNKQLTVTEGTMIGEYCVNFVIH